MFATLDTGLNLVHVRDVARGHLLAAERGQVGEKYILGNADLTLAEIGALLAEITGGRPPRLRIPYAVAWLAAGCMEVAARVTGGTPRASLTAVRMARKRMYFSPAKAVPRARPAADRRARGARATRSSGSSSTATPGSRGRSRDRTPGRPADAEEPLELLLRLPHAAAAAPRRPLRRLRVLPDGGRHRRPRRRARRRPRRAAEPARALASRRRALLRAGRPPGASDRGGGWRAPCAPSRSRARPSWRSSTASRWTSTASGYETADDLYPYCYRVASAVGLCCIEIFGYTDPRAREYAVEPRHRAPADEHHPGRRRRRPRGPRVPAAGRPAKVRRDARTISGPDATPTSS